jgi:hypothetical protein
MSQPYRDIALAIPPAPYKHSFFMRLVRLHQRLRRHFFGEYCNRRPWPCPKCGKRGNAEYIRLLLTGVYGLRGQPRYQTMVEHPCCHERTHIEKPSTYYIPFSRQRLKREQMEKLFGHVTEMQESMLKLPTLTVNIPTLRVPNAEELYERLKRMGKKR